MSIYVIGHKNPDTDAICSAIGYAWFLQETGEREVEAACCGEINARTQFVLSAAGVEAPRLIMDVRPTIGRIARRDVITAREDEALFAVYRRMRQHDIRAFPALDAAGKVSGIVSFSRLMELVLPDHDIDAGARLVETSLERLRAALEGRFLHTVDPGRTEELIVTVAAMSSEGFTQRMHQFPAERTVVVTGDRPTIQVPAIEYSVRCLIITGGYTPSSDVLERAVENGVAILISPHDTATTTLLVRSAKIIGRAVSRTFLSFPESALVSHVARDLSGVAQDLFPVTDESGALTGVFTKSDLMNPRQLRLVLVDHNELAQAVTGADQAEILEVIDHHRLGGGLISRQPIRFINEPVGSTSTIVTKFLKHRDRLPPRGIAICLTAGILTDTLNLTSPTTTPSDREVLAWLAPATGLDLAAFTRQVFAAGSVLELNTPAEAVGMDCKDYSEGEWRFAVAQIEEIGLDLFEARQDALRAALQERVQARGLDFACLLVTDITRHFSILIATGNERILSAIDYPARAPGLFELDGVVSRKKQLLPHLIRILAHRGK